METISNTVWQRRGSSVVFDKASLGEFIPKGAMISLRHLLSWSQGFPDDPPVTGHTLLVSGLEAIIETMEPPAAEAFLARTVRPLLKNLQNRWPACGVVFGFSSHPNAFEVSVLEEELLFRRRDRKTVRLSDGLWDGSAAFDLKRVNRQGENGGEVTVGYYVDRIS